MSSEATSSSGQNNGGSPKAIGNFIKRQEETTRRGTSKLKFTPTLPPRRKKEEPKPDAKPEKPPTDDVMRGEGRGRGRGRGEGRGGAPRAAPQMVATGPLALGPTMAGSSKGSRAIPRSNFAPVAPLGGPTPSSGSGLTPSIKRKPQDSSDQKVTDVDAYSDPDEGVEIVDIDEVKRMDWMAPEALRKEKVREKKKRYGVKQEGAKDKGKMKAEPQDVDLAEEEEQVDLVNALDLSESEEEEEMEDIINDFALQEEDVDMEANIRQEKLYFFQFPDPFPTFLPREVPPSQDVKMAENGRSTLVNNKTKTPEKAEKGKKAVTFAPDVKPPASGASTPALDGGGTKEAIPAVPLDGVIGRLEIHQSGAVKMRLENGILLDVTAATQPSFLQHAVHVDLEKKRLSVLGEVNRRFVVSPNIDALLESLELADQQAQKAMDIDKVDEGLIKMERQQEPERPIKKKKK